MLINQTRTVFESHVREGRRLNFQKVALKHLRVITTKQFRHKLRDDLRVCFFFVRSFIESVLHNAEKN